MRNKKACIPDPNKIFTDAGDEFFYEYSPKVLPDGNIDVQVSGKSRIDDMINSYRDSTDMAYILKQLALGNQEVLNVRQGMFGDFTDMPKTYAEALQLQIDAQKSFNSLPVEVKNKFDNDFNKYFASAGTEDWFSKLGIDLNSEKEVAPAESAATE